MKIRELLCLFMVSIFMSCGVLPHKNNFYETQKNVELGVIGVKKKSVHKTDFEEIGIPNYENLIKISLIEKNFTKKIYNQYLKAIKNKKVLNSVKYIDSIENKPKYFEINLNDKVEVINAINSNSLLFNYLKKTPEAKIVTSLRFVAPKSLSNKLLSADAFYLTTDNQKKQRLYIYKNQSKVGEIDMSKNDVFAYKKASFCWMVTDRKKLKLATILEEGETCKNATNKNVEKLEKELTKSTFKF
ncbi:hypothetical protein [Tenacibaculum aiptasiae]|uniref:hypothetical protein n=1 Tax=Tenacibaculum aiptasiae TaxID=426481 RepID=UPI003B59F1FC